MKNLIFFVFSTIISVQSSTLPSFINPCKKDDPRLNECLLPTVNKVVKRFSKGIPEFQVPPLDPANLDGIKVDIPGLSVKLDDTILTGLGDGKINDFKINLEKNTLKMDYVTNITLKGHYNINGRILILPITGNGDYTIKITNMRLIMKYLTKPFTKDNGKVHWRAELAKRSYKLDKAHFNFQNLFNGNRILAEPTLQFLNENWEVIMNDIAPSAVDQIVYACLNAVNKFYDNVPFENMFI